MSHLSTEFEVMNNYTIVGVISIWIVIITGYVYFSKNSLKVWESISHATGPVKSELFFILRMTVSQINSGLFIDLNEEIPKESRQ